MAWLGGNSALLGPPGCTTATDPPYHSDVMILMRPPIFEPDGFYSANASLLLVSPLLLPPQPEGVSSRAHQLCGCSPLTTAKQY